MSEAMGIWTQRVPGAPILSEARPEPCALAILGISGDLAKRKLIPALVNLLTDELLPENLAVVGVGRRALDLEALRAQLRDGVQRFSRRQPMDDAAWQRVAERLFYVAGDYGAAETYQRLGAQLADIDRTLGTQGNRLFYLATPASAFSDIIRRLGGGLLHPPGRTPWSRVIVEKPFGHDLESARQLNDIAAGVLDETQIFRIDHYLGKETVQNILVLRFGNAIFEPMWNRKYVDHVEITASEALGLEGRGRFYDETGALRDMVQSHLLQVLSLVAMEVPVSFRADDVRDQKVAVFRSLRPLAGDAALSNTVRAQYRGYREEPDVAPDSRTPTYVALRVMLDNWRWQGVPFYLRTGKALAARATEVAIHFHPVPLCLFGRDDVCQRLEPNVLTLRIQPEEGLSLRITSKIPGQDLAVGGVHMRFDYASGFDQQPQEAYERLLLDALRGDATLFWRRDALEQAWGYVTPILEAWEREPEAALATYERGSDGPAEADQLLAREGRLWSPIR
ncbi:MAG TPA: glucose-6-phosphate dehydrogenase [Myxococcota bacterium]